MTGNQNMNRDNLATLAERWMRFWQGGTLDRFNELHIPDFIDHGAAGRGTSRDNFRLSIATLYDAFPDFYATTKDLVIDEISQVVTVRWSATGTHKGSFMYCAPSGKIIHFEGIEIIKCHDGKIIERWGEWDALNIRTQLIG